MRMMSLGSSITYSSILTSGIGNQNATAEGARAIGSVMAITMMGFEPGTLDRLEQELHIIDIQDGEKLRATGNNCSFTHMRDGTKQMFSIYAVDNNQAEILKDEAYLCFKSDPQTKFKRDKPIGIAEHCNGKKGELMDITHVWEYPDGSSYKSSHCLPANKEERVMSLGSVKLWTC